MARLKGSHNVTPRYQVEIISPNNDVLYKNQFATMTEISEMFNWSYSKVRDVLKGRSNQPNGHRISYLHATDKI